MTLGFGTSVGFSYRVDYVEELGTGVWAPLGPEQAGTGGWLTVPDTITGLTPRFYRLVRLP